MRSKLILAAGALVLLAASPASAEEYTAKDLLSPCVEADNDSRGWGQVAELECEQYILGFVNALAVTGNKETCPPKVNTADEVRWAYMRWIHEDYSRRKQQEASAALMGALKEKFPCK